MRLLWLSVLCCALVAGGTAQTLGAAIPSRAGFATRNGYSVAQIASAGITLREYVSPAGVLFGIAWRGLQVPNLRALLGSRFAAYQAAVRSLHRRGPLLVRINGLVVENSGGMRGYQGRIYLAGAIPSGLTAAVVR